MRLYDTHCHPYLAKNKSQEEVLENFFEREWNYLNSIAVDIPTSLTSIEIAQKYPGARASIGIHPTHCLEYKDTLNETIDTLREIYHIHSANIIAIWEAWLDYYWLKSLSEKHKVSEEEIIEIQKDFFRAQIRLARELWLPLIIHNREASEDIFEILVQENFKNFVFHCYSEDYSFAQKLLDFSPECMLWFWGIVTFKNAQAIQEAVRKIPLKNIIIETDSPYLTPVPFRWKQENEPSYTRYILSHIIDLRSESSEEISEQIFKNGTFFFIHN